jgi:ferredoxin
MEDRDKCIHCGFCCRQAPCGFGKIKAGSRVCIHLTSDNLCGIYNKIKNQPSADISPAFGAGCCSGLNPDRRALLIQQKEFRSKFFSNRKVFI